MTNNGVKWLAFEIKPNILWNINRRQRFNCWNIRAKLSLNFLFYKKNVQTSFNTETSLLGHNTTQYRSDHECGSGRSTRLRFPIYGKYIAMIFISMGYTLFGYDRRRNTSSHWISRHSCAVKLSNNRLAIHVLYAVQVNQDSSTWFLSQEEQNWNNHR
jgi:hypothetical protein